MMRECKNRCGRETSCPDGVCTECHHRANPLASEMRLRDWFAGQVMGDMLCGGSLVTSFTLLAERSYQIADAMIVERAKGGG